MKHPHNPNYNDDYGRFMRWLIFFSVCVGLCIALLIGGGCRSCAALLDNVLQAEGAADTGSKNGVVAEAAAPSALSLEWRWGAFDGSRAVEDPSCRLSDLDVGRTALAFRYVSSPAIPAGWARRDTGKGPMVLACAFVWDEALGRWVGGKFDWIDEARTTRPLENIHGGYGGWDPNAWAAAPRHAFCIVSADGKKRSNIVTD